MKRVGTAGALGAAALAALGALAGITAPAAGADPSGCQQGWGVSWCDGPLRPDGTWIRCAEQPTLYSPGSMIGGHFNPGHVNPAKRACYVKGDPTAPPPPMNADFGAPPGHMAIEPGVPG